MSHAHRVADSLLALELELRRLGFWSAEAPSAHALQSTQPFAFDTLTFVEWLQFLFIERMQEIVENDLPFPPVSGVASMAEEYFRGQEQVGRVLIRELSKMDELISDAC